MSTLASRTPRSQLTRRARSLTAVLMIGMAGFVLSACSSGTASADEIENAAEARPGGLRALASVEVPALNGWTIVAERNIDACGSDTNDSDFNEYNIGGYSCAAVRRTLYQLDTANPLADQETAAVRALTEVQSAFAVPGAAPEESTFNVSETPPYLSGRLVVDGKPTRISAHLVAAASADIDILPLWHINETIGGDDGSLVEKLADEDIATGELLVVTTTVTYFSQLRSSD